MLHFTRLLWISMAALLAACGGGGGDTPPEAPAAVARVEIRETGLLLAQAGATRQLSATAYDAQGHSVDTPIGWSSNTPAEIAVDAAGKLTAQVANGSSQIVAEAGGVESAPLLAVVTQLPAGAIALTDAQIVGDPVDTDPNAAPSFANTYKVVLSGTPTPAAGALLINTESKPVGGRVVAVDTSAGQTTVTLRLVSLREMFPQLNIRQTLDLSRAPVTISPAIAAAYDMQRSGNTFSFTPKAGSAGSARQTAAAAPDARALAAGTGVGPFSKCESTLTGYNVLPIQLSQPPVFSLTQSLALELVYTSAGLERLVARGGIGVAYDGTLEVALAFEGRISCEAEVATIRLPVGGILSLAVGGLLPIKVGFEAGGKVTVASAKLGLKAEASAEALVGIACPGGANCEFVHTLTGTADAKPVWELPNFVGDLRFEPSLAAFGKLELAVGSPFLRAIRFNAFEASAGPKLEGSFAPVIDQIADTNYRSDYKLGFESKAGLGSDLDDALSFLGVDSITAVELAGSVDIAKSPVGTVTASRDSFVAGDQVNFRVVLDAATVDFLPLLGPYNAREVVLFRSPPGGMAPLEVARVSAISGQTTFDLRFTATDTGRASEFSAFVVTTLLPLNIFSLELARATAPPTYVLDLQLPSQIPFGESVPMTVSVTMSDGQGGFVPAPDLLVRLNEPGTYNHGNSASPSSGTTSAEGTFTATITAEMNSDLRVWVRVFDPATGFVVAYGGATAVITYPPPPTLQELIAGDYSVQLVCGSVLYGQGSARATANGDAISLVWSVVLSDPGSGGLCHDALLRNGFPTSGSFTGVPVKRSNGAIEIEISSWQAAPCLDPNPVPPATAAFNAGYALGVPISTCSAVIGGTVYTAYRIGP